MSTFVRRDWQPKNEYTTPITGTPIYRNSGIMKAVTKENEKIQVGKITYEHFDNEEFQYIISPFWTIIDTLPANVFYGIPGIDMDLRLEHYYRVNYTPAFMTERTPGPNREDLWELLDSVGLDYYDRLEWLIRTDLRAAVDNLIVERAREDSQKGHAKSRKELLSFIENGQYGDEAIIDSTDVLGRNSKECTKTLTRLMHYGIRLTCAEENIQLQAEDYKKWIPLFSKMCALDEKQRKSQQREGIETAKKNGVYTGRKRKEVDENLLRELVEKFQRKEIALEEVLEITGISKATLYRRMRENKSL